MSIRDQKRTLIKGMIREMWDKSAKDNPRANWGSEAPTVRVTERALENGIAQYLDGTLEQVAVRPLIRNWLTAHRMSA